MTGPLIVPISLRALAVTDLGRDANDPAASFVGASADFSRLPFYRADGTLDDSAPFLSDSVGRYPDVTASLGVKLHWTLPAALRHGRRRDKTGPIVFPPVPDRWLVTRLMRVNDEASLRIKSWVLESDRVECALQPGSATMPFVDKGRTGQFFRYLGRWHDYRSWREDPAGQRFGDIEDGAPLTAIGYGDPLFAAYAPNCPNVFAFDDRFEHTLIQDDRDDAPAMPGEPLAARYSLTYVVAGWYADAGSDPVATLSPDTLRSDYKWNWSGGPETASRMVASGAVVDLSWSAGASPLELPAAPSVAIGPSAAEALSALTARHDALAATDQAEFMLNAIQSGVFKRLAGSPGWTHALEADLHRRGFVPDPGGWQWAVIDARDPKPGMKPHQVAEREVPLNAETAQRLAALNVCQRAYDTAAAIIERGRRQLFADWYRRQLLTSIEQGDVTPPWQDVAPDLTIEGADDLLRARLATLDAQSTVLGRLRIARDGNGDVVDALPASSGANMPDLANQVAKASRTVRSVLHPHWQLKRLPAQRFWRPADPVILLQGEAARSPRRDGGDDDLNDGRLPCRWAHDIPGPRRGGDAGITLRNILGADFEGLADTDKGVAAAAAALVIEALGLSGTFDAALTGVPDFDPAQWRILANSTAPWAAPGEFGLPAPRFARVHGDEQPWTPVVLAWTLRYRPIASTERDGAAQPIGADLLSVGHAPDPAGVELLPTPAPLGEAANYSGWTALSSMATTDLATAVRHAAGTRTAVGERVAKSVRDAPIMAQAAGGFHEALLMFEERPQLRIHNPNEPRLPLADAVRKRAEGQAAHAPVWDKPYAALRSGEIELVAATVIDVFGRRIDAAVGQASWSASYTAGDRAVLPPRFAQSARLNMRWLAARGGEEAGDHPEASPIHGWLVPNLVGGSLDVFSSEGYALGMLKTAGEGAETFWHPGPVEGRAARLEAGDAEDQKAAIERDIADPELCRLVSAIKHGEPGYLGRILTTMDTAVGRIIPPDPGDGPIVLFGRPLALVRARLSIELKGGPATDQGWLSMRTAAAAVAVGDVPPVDDHGLAAVGVPVHLGKTEVLSDGLVGHFLVDQPSGYTMLHSPAAEGDASDVVAATPLILAHRDEPTTVAMLIDPRAQVHATTGLLPVKRLSIPPNTYAPALKRLATTFFAGPMLFPEAAFPIPLPTVAGHAWQWLRPVAGEWKGVTPDAASDDRARLGIGTQRIEDGWLVLSPKDGA